MKICNKKINMLLMYLPFLILLIAPELSYSARQTAIYCLGLDQIEFKLASGEYGIPRKYLKPWKLEELRESDLFGEWTAKTSFGTEFRIEFSTGNNYFYERLDSTNISMSGKYWLKKDDGISIAFEPHFFYLNGDTTQVVNPNTNKTARLTKISLGYMFLQVFPLAYENTTDSSGLFEIRRNGFSFSFTNEPNPIEWKRESQHPACLDLQELKDEYDQQMQKIENFYRKEEKRANSIKELSTEIDNKLIELSNSALPTKEEVLEDIFIPNIEDTLNRPDNMLVSVYLTKIFGSIATYEITALQKIFTWHLKIYLLKKMRSEKEGEIKSMIDGYIQEKGAKQCAVFKNNVKKLYREMRCKKVEIHPLFQ